MFQKEAICSGFPLFISGSHHEEDSWWCLPPGNSGLRETEGKRGNSTREQDKEQIQNVREKKQEKGIW